MAIDEKIELEIVLRDLMSGTLKSISRQLNASALQLQDSGVAGLRSLSNVSQQVQNLGNQGKQTTQSLTGMRDLIVIMAKSLGTPGVAVGIVGGFIAAGKILEGFATKRVQLQMFSADVGFSVSQISVMQRTMARMGMDKGSAGKVISQIGSELKEMSSSKQLSPLFDRLVKFNQIEFAGTLLANVESGNFDQAFKLIVKRYEEIAKVSTGAARYFATHVIGVNESFLKNYNKYSEGVRPAFEADYQHSKEYLAKTEQLTNDLKTFWGRVQEAAIGALIKIDEWDKKLKEWKGIPGWGPKAVRPGQSVQPEITNEYWREHLGLPPLIQGPELPEQEKTEIKKDTKEVVKDQRDILQRMWDWTHGIKPQPRQEGGPVAAGERYVVGEQGPELFGAGGQYQLVGEGGPEVIRPTVAGQIWPSAKAFAGGGLVGLAEQRGYTAPDWIKSAADFLARGDVQYAAGFMHAGLGGASTKMHVIDMMLDTATALPREMPRASRLYEILRSARLAQARAGESRQSGGPVEAGKNYLVGESGPEIFEVDPHQLAFIKGLGMTETGFRREEAYSERYNTARMNANVRRYGERGADYGYYQMNEMDVDDAVRRGVPRGIARHLNGGGRNGTSTLEEQTLAMNEYMKKKYPTRYSEVGRRGRDIDFEKLRRSARGQWFGLKDQPKVARREFRKGHYGDVASIFPQIMAERERMDRTMLAENAEPSVDVAINATNVPSGVTIDADADGDAINNFTLSKTRQVGWAAI